MRTQSPLFFVKLILLCSSSFSFTPTHPIISKTKSFKLRRYLFQEQCNEELTFTQVLSDVDDTLKSSGGLNVGGVALGGIDVQYDRGELYPGVAQFMLELSAYPLQSKAGTTKETFAPAKVAILTARAEEFKAALEIKSSSKLAKSFREAGTQSGYDDWGLGPVLYGSVAEWIIQERKGLRKFTNFERLLQQDSTSQILNYIYVGDTGELDQEAGEHMLRYYPELVKAVFLHAISGEDLGADQYLPIPPAKLINGRPLVFFRTYVGAAAKAAQLGLMSEDGLVRVIRAAEESLTQKGVKRDSGKWRDLEKDVADALRTIQTPLSSNEFS